MRQEKLLSLITSAMLFEMCGEDPFMGHHLLAILGGTNRAERRRIHSSKSSAAVLFHDD